MTQYKQFWVWRIASRHYSLSKKVASFLKTDTGLVYFRGNHLQQMMQIGEMGLCGGVGILIKIVREYEHWLACAVTKF